MSRNYYTQERSSIHLVISQVVKLDDFLVGVVSASNWLGIRSISLRELVRVKVSVKSFYLTSAGIIITMFGFL